MTTAAADTSLLEEFDATREGQRSGAIDLAWEGVRATIYFVFGQPSHATYTNADGVALAGNEALDRLVNELPDHPVAAWRRVMVPEDTLRCSIEELTARCGGPPTAAGAAPAFAAAPSPPPPVVPFTVEGFPLLPLGISLWSDTAVNVVHLDMLTPKLPDSLIVLSAAGRRGAAVIARGAILDAVWVDATGGLVGAAAAKALMRSEDGTVAGFGLEDERLLAAIPLLWRAPRTLVDLHAEWLDADRLLADVRAEGRSCALIVEGPARGVALVSEGELVATYTAQRPEPSSSPAALRALLRTPGARITVATDADFRSFQHRRSAVSMTPDPVTAVVEFVPGVVDDDIPESSPAAMPATDTLPADGPPAEPHLAEASAIVADEAVVDPAADNVPPPPPATPEIPVFRAPSDVDGPGDIGATGTVDAPTNVLPEAGFVAPRLPFDDAALRAELVEIARVWLGADDVGPVEAMIAAARPGVDEFVGTIAAIGALTLAGHESAVVRAMAREMHFRAAEILCGV